MPMHNARAQGSIALAHQFSRIATKIKSFIASTRRITFFFCLFDLCSCQSHDLTIGTYKFGKTEPIFTQVKTLVCLATLKRSTLLQNLLPWVTVSSHIHWIWCSFEFSRIRTVAIQPIWLWKIIEAMAKGTTRKSHVAVWITHSSIFNSNLDQANRFYSP